MSLIDTRSDQQIADDMAAAGTPPMSEDALDRLASSRSGLIHALLVIRKHRQRASPDLSYSAIPAHHTRKRRDAQRLVDALAAVEAEIEEMQQGCALRLRVESLRKDQPNDR